jgi:DNA-directed RNA polymerase subunit omega
MSKRKAEKSQAVEVVETKPPDQAWFIPADEERSIYRFIIAAAKRARQLQGGARPLISTTSRKPTKIAMEEVRRSEIPVEIQPDPEKEAAAAEE